MTYDLQLSQWQAIVGAADGLAREGGGTMWLHHPDCSDPELTEDCDCLPVGVEVPALT